MKHAATKLALGPTIRQARIRLGLSLRQAAELANIPKTTIERIEHGYALRPRPDVLFALGRVLDLPVEDLYSLANYPSVQALPSFAPYLHARYQGLSPDAISELERYFTDLAKREGITLDSPAPGQDET